MFRKVIVIWFVSFVLMAFMSRTRGFNPVFKKVVHSSTQKVIHNAEYKNKIIHANNAKSFDEIVPDPTVERNKRNVDSLGISAGLALCMIFSSVSVVEAFEGRNFDISSSTEPSYIEKMNLGVSINDILDSNSFLVSNDISMENVDEASLSVTESEQKNSAKIIAQEGGKWFFIVYVVFSFAAGGVELVKRFQTWLENRQQ